MNEMVDFIIDVFKTKIECLKKSCEDEENDCYIIDCFDCEYFIEPERFKTALESSTRILEEDIWISCDKKLPDLDEDPPLSKPVLLWYKGRHYLTKENEDKIGIAYYGPNLLSSDRGYHDKPGWRLDVGNYEIECKDAVAWRPLPDIIGKLGNYHHKVIRKETE